MGLYWESSRAGASIDVLHLAVLHVVLSQRSEQEHTQDKDPKHSLKEEFSSQNAHRLSKQELVTALQQEGWFDRESVSEMEDLTPKQVLNYNKTQGWDSQSK